MKSKILIIGLGQIGYSLAEYITKIRKIEVDGYDINETVIKKGIRDGIIKNKADNFSGYDYYLVCISTHSPSNLAEPYVDGIFDIARRLSKEGKTGALLGIESTVDKGTSRKVIEILKHKIHVCHVPHRFYSGDIVNHGHQQLRILGACEPCCQDKAKYFYRNLLDIPLHTVSSPDIAELTKLIENTYRFVEISFAEELKLLCDKSNINYDELRNAINTKWNINILEARDGIGGHCLPKDTQMYLNNLKKVIKSNSIVESSMIIDYMYRENFGTTKTSNYLKNRFPILINKENTHPKTKIALVFGAHPDDIEIGMAGTVVKLVSSGYKVQPVPAPFSIVAENINNNKLGTNNQKLILFNLGNLVILIILIIFYLLKILIYH